MKKNYYEDQYNDPRWLEKREIILKRDSYHCRSCFNEELTNLQVHHIYYEAGKKVWDYPDDALITVCTECHGLIHKNLDEAKQILSEMFYYGLPEMVSLIKACRYFSPLQIEMLVNFLVTVPSAKKDNSLKDGWIF